MTTSVAAVWILRDDIFDQESRQIADAAEREGAGVWGADSRCSMTESKPRKC